MLLPQLYVPKRGQGVWQRRKPRLPRHREPFALSASVTVLSEQTFTHLRLQFLKSQQFHDD